MEKSKIEKKLFREKVIQPKPEEKLINEVHKILNNDLLNENKILNHLSHYMRSFEKLNEEEILDQELLFTVNEIKSFCIKYRLKFLSSEKFCDEIPYEAILKIKHLNANYRKDLKDFKIISYAEHFIGKKQTNSGFLFAPTNHGNYCLVHAWGNNIPNTRKWRYLPMRNFETLFITVTVISAILAVSLPTRLIWLPKNADYWGGYRIGAFMHILIFNLGITAYITFAFSRNFSSSNWNTIQDF